MTRLDSTQLAAALAAAVGATPDPSGHADLVWEKGLLLVAADPAEFKAVFKRAKALDGYKWVAINREDLFAANPLSLGSKAGIIDATGAVLKAADVPRKKV